MKKMRFILLFAALLFAFTLPTFAAEPASGGGFAAFLEEFILENADTLISILTLCGSVLIAVLYKTGLLPLMTRSLGSIGATVKHAAESADTLSAHVDAELAALQRTLQPAMAEMQKLGQEFAALQEGLSQILLALKEGAKEQTSLKTALEGEAELVYGVLQAAALPQYQKEQLAESYTRMRRKLSEAENV